MEELGRKTAQGINKAGNPIIRFILASLVMLICIAIGWGTLLFVFLGAWENPFDEIGLALLLVSCIIIAIPLALSIFKKDENNETN